MDKLPESLLLEILSRLDNSADVACCRVASKAFNNVFPDLRSINLLCSWRGTSGSISSSCFKKVFLDFISKLRVVESVCIRLHVAIGVDPIGVDPVDEEFLKEWLPRVSQTLKSLSLSDLPFASLSRLNVLPLISKYCHNLAELNLSFAWLSVDYLNPMPMLTTLTLAYSSLQDEHLNELNKCFPNLQVLKLVGITGLKDPKIHLLNLQTCHWSVYNKQPSSLTLITPNLITLRIVCGYHTAIHVEAPKLSHFHLSVDGQKHPAAFTAKKFENLKTLWLDSCYIGFLLSEFPTTKTVETLILDLRNKAPRDARDSKLTLGKVFMVFPNVSSLRINSGAWSELEACLNREGWESFDGRIGLKTICAYLMLVDPSSTFSYVACLLDQCVDLSVVSLLIHCGVDGTRCKSFRSKCMARWPGLKWRWGIWGKRMKDTWITDLYDN